MNQKLRRFALAMFGGALVISNSCVASVECFSSESTTVGIGAAMESVFPIRLGDVHGQYVSQSNKSIVLNTATAVHAFFTRRLPNDWEVVGRVGLMTTNSSSPIGSDRLERTFIALNHAKYGQFELGNRKSAGNDMKSTADSVAVGSGGVDGPFSTYATLFYKGGPDESQFLNSLALVVSESLKGPDGYKGRYAKVIYKSPVFNGFSFGISYGPDNSYNGTAPNTLTTHLSEFTKSKARNIWSSAISWKKKMNDKSISLTIAGEHASHVESADEIQSKKSFRDYQAMTVSAVYECGANKFAASYGTHFKSSFASDSGAPNSYIWAVGASHALSDKTSISLTAMHSNKIHNKLQLIVFGVETKPLPGLSTYAELGYGKADQINRIEQGTYKMVPVKPVKNSAGLLLVGIKIAV